MITKNLMLERKKYNKCLSKTFFLKKSVLFDKTKLSEFNYIYVFLYDNFEIVNKEKII